jgi:glycerol kinase
MADDGVSPSIIRVDGGMVTNDWFLQFLADILNIGIERPKNVESSVLGAAYLAGYRAGVFSSVEDIAQRWQRDAQFLPSMPDDLRERLLEGWSNAVSSVLTRD